MTAAVVVAAAVVMTTTAGFGPGPTGLAGATMPRNSLDDRRPDRMPPSAPELDRCAGTSTSSTPCAAG